MTSGVVFPRTDAAILADDGDSLTFCSTCAFSQACLSEGMDKSALMDLHVLVEHVGPLKAGDHVFREGDAFSAIAAVRAGTVKTYLLDSDGREQVLGFHLPGEVIGLNAVHDDRYPCNAVALDMTQIKSRCECLAVPADRRDRRGRQCRRTVRAIASRRGMSRISTSRCLIDTSPSRSKRRSTRLTVSGAWRR